MVGVAMRRRFYCCHGLPMVASLCAAGGAFWFVRLTDALTGPGATTTNGGVVMRRRFYCCHGLPRVGVAKRRRWCILVRALKDALTGP